jgi:glycosyltransferase involved in cell wall biosynthesis
MTQQPLVSILIPAYNAERWIAQTVHSALNQTYTRTECVILDDGSTDDTWLIAQQLAAGKPNVKVVSQFNRGASAARNAAYKLAQGDYIQWLDADDLLSPNKIAQQVARLEDDFTLLSCAWGRFFYCTNRAHFQPTPLWADLSQLDWLRIKMGQNHHMQPATWLVSRKISDLIGPWNEQLTFDDDGEYFARVLLAAEGGVKFVPQSTGACVYYRNAGADTLSHVTPKKLDSLYYSMLTHIEIVRSMDDGPETRDACLKYISTWSWFFEGQASYLSRLQDLAQMLGGELVPFQPGWKHRAVKAVAGSTVAHAMQTAVPKFKCEVNRVVDRLHYLTSAEAR